MPPSLLRSSPHITGAVLTCSLLADVGQIVVAGHVVPFAILMRYHNHTVLPSGEEVVWLVFSPVLILLRHARTHTQLDKYIWETITKLFFKPQLNIIFTHQLVTRSWKSIFFPNLESYVCFVHNLYYLFSFPNLLLMFYYFSLCDLFALNVIMENENTTEFKCNLNFIYSFNKLQFGMFQAAILWVSGFLLVVQSIIMFFGSQGS